MSSSAGSAARKAVGAARGIVWELLRHRVVSLPPTHPVKGRVLLSYLTAPFSRGRAAVSSSHSNLWECSEMARTFQTMGYAVDVIDWDDSDFVPRREYDILVDIHGNLERLAPQVGERCLKVLHITGSHWLHQNGAEYERLAAIRDRRGAALVPRRTVPACRGMEVADCATLLGNDATLETWRYAGKRIFRIPATSVVYPPLDKAKDMSACRNRFVWLGGPGMAVKGLDLVLEAFAGMPDLSLTVCGPVEVERDFAEAYDNELRRTANIKSLGWVDVTSDRFREVADRSAGLVYPSASEGASIGVLTCMSFGLIPIVTPQSGVDVSPFGTVLEDASVRSIQEAVRALSVLGPDELRSRAAQTHAFVNEKHSREAFTEAYSGAAREMVRMSSGRK